MPIKIVSVDTALYEIEKAVHLHIHAPGHPPAGGGMAVQLIAMPGCALCRNVRYAIDSARSQIDRHAQLQKTCTMCGGIVGERVRHPCDCASPPPVVRMVSLHVAREEIIRLSGAMGIAGTTGKYDAEQRNQSLTFLDEQSCLIRVQ